MAEFEFSFWKQLNQVEHLIVTSPGLPFSDIRLINKGRVVDILNAIRDNLPAQLAEAAQLIKQRDIFIAQTQFQGKILIQKACQHRYQLTKINSVLRETEFQLMKLRERTHEQCEKLLRSTRRKVIESRQEYEIVTAYIGYRYSIRYNELEERYNKLRSKLYESNFSSREQCLGELDSIRNTGSHLQRNSQIELERLHDGVLRFRQRNQLQCETLINELRRDSILINQDVTNYTEEALIELENRIQEMNRTIMRGRLKIFKLRSNESSIMKQDIHDHDAIKDNLTKSKITKWSLSNWWR
uniref:Uncharacterized protein n=1 Tax=Paulinella longichromatophora TaxID=1708747 RepID=A0A2H4ZNR7_9EUKA|nr:hypothetical protein PLO_186 [Paulinella longichromatophora]